MQTSGHVLDRMKSFFLFFCVALHIFTHLHTLSTLKSSILICTYYLEQKKFQGNKVKKNDLIF